MCFFRAPPPSHQLNAYKMSKIVTALFPTYEIRAKEIRPTEPPSETPLFTIDELQLAVRKLKPNKSPGPDGIPVEILKAITENYTKLLL